MTVLIKDPLVLASGAAVAIDSWTPSSANTPAGSAILPVPASAPWQRAVPGAGNGFNVATNGLVLVVPPASRVVAYRNDVAMPADCYAEIAWQATPGALTARVGPLLRVSGSSPNDSAGGTACYINGCIQMNTGVPYIQYRVSGAAEVAVSGTAITHSWVADDRIRLTVTGQAGVGSGIMAQLQVFPAGSTTPINAYGPTALPSAVQVAAMNAGGAGVYNGAANPGVGLMNFEAGDLHTGPLPPTPPTGPQGAFTVRTT